MKAYTEHVDSLAALYLDILQRPTLGGNSSHSDPASAGWDLGAGWSGIQTLISEGWSEGASKVDRGLGELFTVQGELERNEWTPDRVGAFVNVPAYLAGTPDDMYRYTPTAHRTPIVRVIVPVNMLSNVKAAAAMRRGIAVVALVDNLENSGYQIELVAGVYNKNRARGGHKACVSGMSVVVKHPGEHVNIAQLATVLAHPGWYRRVGFAWKERSTIPQVVESTRGFYGATLADPQNTEWKQQFIDAVGGGCLLPGIDPARARWTIHDHYRYLSDVLHKYLEN